MLLSHKADRRLYHILWVTQNVSLYVRCRHSTAVCVIICQVAQLSQRDRAARWVSFGQKKSARLYSASNIVGAKIKALIFYTINPLLYEKVDAIHTASFARSRVIAIRITYTRLAWLANPNPNPTNPMASCVSIRIALCIDTFIRKG